MANLTQFLSSPPSFEGRHVVTRFVTETEYNNIMTVNTAVPVDTGNPLYDPAFASTLYYVREDA